MARKILGFTTELLKIVIISLAVILPIRFFLIQPFYVNGASMEPNFFDQEYLIVDEISYRFDDPSRGDIIVFKNPENTSETFIKRIIGLPGEKVQLKNGEIFIINEENPEGTKVEEAYLDETVRTYNFNEGITELKEGEFFVLGDNRNFSKDSRIIGPVSKDLITGRVVLRGWPISRFTIFGEEDYNI